MPFITTFNKPIAHCLVVLKYPQHPSGPRRRHLNTMAGRPQLETVRRSGFSNRIFRMGEAGPEIMGWDFGGGPMQLMKAKFHCIL